jgi:hypothetical protein
MEFQFTICHDDRRYGGGIVELATLTIHAISKDSADKQVTKMFPLLDVIVEENLIVVPD